MEGSLKQSRGHAGLNSDGGMLSHVMNDLEEWLKADKSQIATLREIAAKYAPEDIQITYIKSLGGLCDFDKHRIKAPRPVNMETLLIFLHECAHWLLHQGSNEERGANFARQEYEATMWAFDRVKDTKLLVKTAAVDHMFANILMAAHNELYEGRTTLTIEQVQTIARYFHGRTFDRLRDVKWGHRRLMKGDDPVSVADAMIYREGLRVIKGRTSYRGVAELITDAETTNIFTN